MAARISDICRKAVRSILIPGCVALPLLQLSAQVPFSCEGQVFAILEETNTLVRLTINPVNNAVQPGATIGILDTEVNGIGFRKTDGFLYGVGPFDHHLYRIDANGKLDDLGRLELEVTHAYLAGDVTPDGRHLVVIGSHGGADQTIVTIDLEDPGHSVEINPIIGTGQLTDVAFDPYTGMLLGYDAGNHRFVRIDLSAGTMTQMPEISEDNDVHGPYYNAYGELRAYGSTAFGVTNAILSVNENTGRERIVTNGSPLAIVDVASCPYSVEIRNAVSPRSILPCIDVAYTLTMGNASGRWHSGVTVDLVLPQGLTFNEITRNPFGGSAAWDAQTNTLHIDGMSIAPGVDSMTLAVSVGDVAERTYRVQAQLGGLPADLGGTRVSDDPASIPWLDSTALKVFRFDEDSIEITRFLCLGDTLLLDGSLYGNDLLWSDGSTDSELSVAETGEYHLIARTDCRTAYVNYSVTVASCPFTIELNHTIVPREALACSEVIFRYEVDNASGVSYTNVGFLDTLPKGMTFIDFASDPFGGLLVPDLPDDVIKIEGITLPIGVDSFDVLVEVGDLAPGEYRNGAMLIDLPQEIGPVRFSDDPLTHPHDSTAMTVIGTGTDSLYVDRRICSNADLVLDGSLYGMEHEWFDGSTEPQVTIEKPGFYELRVYNGCKPTYVFFNVTRADDIAVTLAPEHRDILLGDTILLSPGVYNAGDSVRFEWYQRNVEDPLCTGCSEFSVRPVDDATYIVRATNGQCSDSAQVTVDVDNTRRIYAPTAFSPNYDGVNDQFYLQSPDYGMLRRFSIANRWGDVVYSASDIVISDSSSGWNGEARGRTVPAGVYVWHAEVEFLDGVVEVYTGQVTLLR